MGQSMLNKTLIVGWAVAVLGGLASAQPAGDRYGRAEGVALTRLSAIAIGLVAGVALAMKPHYLAIPAAVELFLLVRRGWRATLGDPIPWSIGLVALGHFVAMYTIFADFGRNQQRR